MKPFLTRKDIASMMPDVTVDQVRKNEAAWGLDKCRCDRNARVVRYSTSAVLLALKAHEQKFILPPEIEKANPLKYF